MTNHSVTPTDEKVKSMSDVWPASLNVTVAIFLPILFWLGFLAGWLGAKDGVL